MLGIGKDEEVVHPGGTIYNFYTYEIADLGLRDISYNGDGDT